MLNQATLARPYARAAFSAARDGDALERWSEALELASVIAATPEVQFLVDDPRVERDQLLGLFTDIGGERFDRHFGNFLRTLERNGRLQLLPEIAVQFERYRRDAESRIRIEVASALPLSDEEAEQLAQRLKKRFGREVELDVEVDESLIGGAVIRAGDQVIDGSVRGRLEQLGRRMAG